MSSRFTPQFLDDIRARMPVSAVVGKRLTLKKAGAEWQAMSPFNKEKTPSFTVNDQKGFWHDFSSGKHGDIFGFLMEVEGMSFVDAVKQAASEAGLALPNNEKWEPRPPKMIEGPIAPTPEDEVREEKPRGRTKRKVVATYDYENEQGYLVYQVVRFNLVHDDGTPDLNDQGKPKKTFGQRRPFRDEDGRWIWGLDAGEFMRKGPGTDWIKFDAENYRAWKYTERRRFTDTVEHGLYKVGELKQAIADERTIWLCYSSDTEVLTPDGWVAFPDLKNQAVAQWKMDGQISFVEPTAKQRFEFSGEMVSVKSDDVDLLVTPDHRQPVDYKTNSHVYPLRVVKASELRGQHRIPLCGNLAGGAVGPTEAQARLIVAWLADGSWHAVGRQVHWNLKKERKKRRLRKVLREVGVQWNEHRFQSTDGWTYFSVSKDALAMSNGGWSWSPSKDKRWSWAMIGWPISTRLAALDEMSKWDGDKVSASSRLFTGERQTADVAAAVAVVSGHGASVRVDQRVGRNDSFVINVKPKSRSAIRRPRLLPYQGLVYCCTVPSGFLVIRRAGKICVSGNCEGEKKADTLILWELAATTNSGGAKHFTDKLAAFFGGADVVVVVDNDEVGRQRGHVVAATLRRAGAKRVRILDLARHWSDCPPKADVTDWADAGGTADKLYEIAERTPDWQPEPPKSTFGAIRFIDLDLPAREHEWLIKGLLPRGGIAMALGKWQSGKSFFTLDVGFTVAEAAVNPEVLFLGRRVRGGLVLYQAGEAGTGLKLRTRAVRAKRGISPSMNLPFVIMPEPLNMYASDDPVNRFIAESKGWASYYEMPLELVIIDTFSAATPGANENSSEHVSAILERGNRLARELQATIMWVHHLNAIGDKARGHSSLMGNVDTVIEITETETIDAEKIVGGRTIERTVREAKVIKQKEQARGFHWNFVLKQVEVGRDEDGDPITTCIVAPTGEQSGPTAAPAASKSGGGVFLTDERVGLFQALLRALDDGGVVPPRELNLPPSVHKVVEWGKFRFAYRKRVAPLDEDADKHASTIKKRLQRFQDFITNSGIAAIDSVGETTYVWPTRKPVYGRGLQWPQRMAVPDEAHDATPIDEATGEPITGLDGF